MIILFLANVALTASGTVPAQLSVQGVLRDGQGGLESGSFQFTINVYAAQTGGTTLWTETQSSISVESGFFTLVLGTADTGGQTIAQVVESNPTPLWVGVQLQGDPQELPRIQLNAVPYAFIADHATTVDSFGTASADQISKLFASTKCTSGDAVVGLNADGSLMCAAMSGGSSLSADGTTIANNSGVLSAAVPLSSATTVATLVTEASTIGTLVSSASTISTLVSDEPNLHTLAADESTIATLVSDESNLHTLAGDESNLHTLAGDKTSLTALVSGESCTTAGQYVNGVNTNGTLSCATPFGGSGGSYTADGTTLSLTSSQFSIANPITTQITSTSNVSFAGAKVNMPISYVKATGYAACPANATVIGGGCDVGSGNDHMERNCPATSATACTATSPTGWACVDGSSGNGTAYVICLQGF